MNGFALLLATAALGVDYGWQPASDGRLEYIIQIEPITLIALREGQEVVSQIDPLVRDVRRFRIRVGTEVVPRVGTPVQAAAPTFSAAASVPPPGVTYGWQPVNEQQVELIVQLSPERLASLKNDPVVGEIPVELRSVARVRIRSGTANLPRQNVPQIGPPVTASAASGQNPQAALPAATADSGRTPYGTAVPGNPQGNLPPSSNTPGPSLPSGQPANMTNNPAGSSGAGNVTGANNANNPNGGANTAGGWPSTTVGDTANPPRYNPPNNPPAMSPAADPRAVSSPNPDYSRPSAPATPANGWQQPPPNQNPNWQPSEPSWQTASGQNPSWPAAPGTAPGGQVPTSSASLQPLPNPSGQPGMSDPNAYRPGDGWSAPQGNSTGAPPPVSSSPPWGSLDDRYAAERGQPPIGYSPAASSNWGQASAPTQPPSSSFSQPSAWPPSIGRSQAQSEMASPFAATSAGFDGRSGSSQASTERTSSADELDFNDTVFLGKASKKKSTDFWDELAASANDPSFGFLREGSVVSELADSDKPWWPLTLAMLALFASMGGNLYMGWIAVDVYRRYLDMAEEGDDDPPYESPRRRERDEAWDEDRPRRRERVAVED